MGKIKYLKDVESLFKKSMVVNSFSISRITKNKQYTKQMIRNLISKKKINRLGKGCYTIHDDPSLAVFCFKPSYLGLQDALSFNNLWEQETIPIIVTTAKVRQGIRNILGTNVMIRRINKKYLFGFDYHNYSNFYLPYSDIEKTLIDLIYFKQPIDKETLKEIIKRIDEKKLIKYLKVYPERIMKRVINAVKNKKV